MGNGLLCIAPLALLFLILGTWSPGPTPGWDAWTYAILPGFAEELFFRAMLFGLLFRIGGWGFVPASGVGVVVFGLAHMSQGSSLGEVFGIVAITGLGAAWFSWLYAEWGWNLWLSITLHALMNLSWSWFDISNNALGSALGNVGRVLVILTSVALTIRRIRKQGGSILQGRWWRSPPLLGVGAAGEGQECCDQDLAAPTGTR